MTALVSRLRADWSGVSQSWRRDTLSSVVVFLVALPLCMGIAIASGMPPAAGLVTGILGGLVVGVLASAPLQVSGPAAGLAVIVWDLVQTHGVGPLGWIVLVAGGIQLLAGLARMGQWFRAVSPAVIHGMLAGIGVLIFASQFHVMVDDAPRGSGLENLIAIPEAIYKGFVPMDGSLHSQAAMVGLFTLVVMVAWRPLAPAALRVVPAPLVAVVAATVAAMALGLGVNRVEVPERLVDALVLPALADLGGLGWTVLSAGLALAFVASAETLLCATAVDKMHRGPRTHFDRELAAQGVGNMLCGALGALPMTGVIVRSSANVESGGRTRLSAVLHGVWLLLFCAALPFVLREIPTAVLAAVLVLTGYKLVNVAAIRQLARFGREEIFIYAATLVGIVCVDLLTGVVLGIGLSLARLLYEISHLEIEIREGSEPDRLDLVLRGAATVMRLPKLAAALEQVPPSVALHVHLEELGYIDHACMDLLMSWEKQHESQGGQLYVDWPGLEARFRSKGPRTAAAATRGAARAA
jgi:MFS superfamily sulfate permease-like transporter